MMTMMTRQERLLTAVDRLAADCRCGNLSLGDVRDVIVEVCAEDAAPTVTLLYRTRTRDECEWLMMGVFVDVATATRYRDEWLDSHPHDNTTATFHTVTKTVRE